MRSIAIGILLISCASKPATSTTHRASGDERGASPANAESTAAPDDAVAKVGPVWIRGADVDALLRTKLASVAPEKREAVSDVAKDAIIEQLIERTQLAGECERLGIRLSPHDVARAMQEARANVEDWDAHLRSLGETEASAKARITSELQRRALLFTLGDFTITDAKISAAYDREWASRSAKRGWVRVSTATLADSAGFVEKTLGPTCNRYIVAYRACLEKAPDEARGAMREALDASIAAWRQAAEGPAREFLEPGCQTAFDAAAKVTTAMGCDWSAPKPATSLRAAATQLRAALLRESNAFEKVAREAGALVETSDEFVPREQLPRDLATALAKLKDGQLSRPVPTPTGYLVAKLEASSPPGPLPLAACRAQVVQKLQEDALRHAQAKLRENLARFQPVTRLHDAFEEKPVDPA